MAHHQDLREFYMGKDVGDVPKPALVLDAAIIRRHCRTMIRTVKELGVGFRAHVKSHKVSLGFIPKRFEESLTDQDRRDCRNAS